MAIEGEEAKAANEGLLGEATLLIAVLTALTYLCGANYYEGYFRFYGLRAYRLGIPASTLSSGAEIVMWPLFGAIAVCLILAAASRGFRSARAKSTLRLLAVLVLCWPFAFVLVRASEITEHSVHVPSMTLPWASAGILVVVLAAVGLATSSTVLRPLEPR